MSTATATFEGLPGFGRQDGASPEAWPQSVVPTESFGMPVHAVLTRADPSASHAVLRSLRALPAEGVLITFVNPATVKLARTRADFVSTLRAFTLVLPDGIGLCLAMRWLHGLAAQRVSFDMTSLAPIVLDHARAEGLTVVLVGGAAGIAERARDRLTDHFPGLQVVGWFDGYGATDETARQVAALQPHIVVCGMGTVRQEAFLLRVSAEGWRGWGFTCGGFFDQLQAGMHYYPRWVDRANLRWAYRLAREPKRLWRRYVLDYGQFVVMVLTALAQRTWDARFKPARGDA